MKTQLIIILSVCYAGSLTGCAKIRQMTRRDFAVLNDPFVDDSAVASQESSQRSLNASAPAGAEGYARVDASRQAQPATATSPFQTASRSRTIVPESTTAGLARIAAGQMPSQKMPTASAAPAAQQMDMADMASFMKKQAEASGLKETAKDLEADFEAFAAARQKEWSQEVQGMKQQASGKIQQVANQASAFGAAAMPSLPDMSFDDGFATTETAEPLIRQMSGQASAAAASARATVSEIVTEMPNPFLDQGSSAEVGNSDSPFSDNPFSFEQPVAKAAQSMATSRPSMSRHAATGRSSGESALDDFAAFADSQLTGKITPSSSSTSVQPNPFSDFDAPAKPAVRQTSQQAPGVAGFGSQSAKTSSRGVTSTKPNTDSAGKLDHKFGFDVGWRPANMERR